MLERPEAAAVAFATGLVVVVVGLIGVSTSSFVNAGFIVAGAVLSVASAVWWRMLRRGGSS